MTWEKYQREVTKIFRQENPGLCDYSKIEVSEAGEVFVSWEGSSYPLRFEVVDSFEDVNRKKAV